MLIRFSLSEYEMIWLASFLFYISTQFLRLEEKLFDMENEDKILRQQVLSTPLKPMSEHLTAAMNKVINFFIMRSNNLSCSWSQVLVYKILPARYLLKKDTTCKIKMLIFQDFFPVFCSTLTSFSVCLFLMFHNMQNVENGYHETDQTKAKAVCWILRYKTTLVGIFVWIWIFILQEQLSAAKNDLGSENKLRKLHMEKQHVSSFQLYVVFNV